MYNYVYGMTLRRYRTKATVAIKIRYVVLVVFIKTRGNPEFLFIFWRKNNYIVTSAAVIKVSKET